MRPETPLDPDLTPREVVVAGERYHLFHTETGGGAPVVAVHGLPASSRDFRWFDSALGGRVRLFRLDLPGFGESPPPSRDDVRPTELGRVVAAFCESVDLSDVTILGHSLGGAVALAAATSPRIARVALVNSCGPQNHRGNFPRLYRVLNSIMDLHPLARRAVIRSTRPVADRIFSKRISDEEFVWASRLAMRYDPTLFERQLRALRKPTLVAWATQDPAVQPEVSLETLGCAVDAESLRIEAKTHNLQATHAVELADTLLEWIASTSDSAAVSR